MSLMLPDKTGVAFLRLLLVEDSVSDAELFRAQLDADAPGVSVRWVQTLEGAREVLDEGFDCVLLDLGLPDSHGLEGLRALRGQAPAVPIVVLTGRNDRDFGLDAVGAGAQDYVTKGSATAGAVVRAARYAIERQRAQGLLERRALQDPLTGLGNRALLLDRLGLALARRRRNDTPLALLFMDLDGFKAVNDSAGHAAGDRLLVEVAAALRAALRGEDTAARFGGDEFAVLCEDVPDPAAVTVVAERILAAVAGIGGATRNVSFSVGAAISRAGETPEQLLERADAAMYEAKRAGKDRWALAGQPSLGRHA